MVKECVLPMTHIHKACIQIGHDFSYAADINVAHGVLHVSPITVELNELSVLEKGNVNARRRRIDDEFGVHHMKSRRVRMSTQPHAEIITSSCDGSYEDASYACAWPSYDACAFFRLA